MYACAQKVGHNNSKKILIKRKNVYINKKEHINL